MLLWQADGASLTAHGRILCRVFPDVNPGIIEATLKLFEDMSYSDIYLSSKSSVFLPLLSLLLLVEKLKLQLR